MSLHADLLDDTDLDEAVDVSGEEERQMVAGEYVIQKKVQVRQKTARALHPDNAVDHASIAGEPHTVGPGDTDRVLVDEVDEVRRDEWIPELVDSEEVLPRPETLDRDFQENDPSWIYVGTEEGLDALERKAEQAQKKAGETNIDDNDEDAVELDVAEKKNELTNNGRTISSPEPVWKNTHSAESAVNIGDTPRPVSVLQGVNVSPGPQAHHTAETMVIRKKQTTLAEINVPVQQIGQLKNPPRQAPEQAKHMTPKEQLRKLYDAGHVLVLNAQTNLIAELRGNSRFSHIYVDEAFMPIVLRAAATPEGRQALRRVKIRTPKNDLSEKLEQQLRETAARPIDRWNVNEDGTQTRVPDPQPVKRRNTPTTMERAAETVSNILKWRPWRRAA